MPAAYALALIFVLVLIDFRTFATHCWRSVAGLWTAMLVGPDGALKVLGFEGIPERLPAP